MEWVAGAYFLIGLVKAIAKVSDGDPTEKPIWMITQGNSLKWALLFAVYVLLWPFTPKRSRKDRGGTAQ